MHYFNQIIADGENLSAYQKGLYEKYTGVKAPNTKPTGNPLENYN